MKSKRDALFIAASSLAAGLVNTLVGAGGGVFLIFTLQFLVGGVMGKGVYSMTNAAVMIFSLVSVVSYISGGAFVTGELVPFLLPALIGGIVGAFLLGRIKTSYLRLIFAAISFYSGVKMIL